MKNEIANCGLYIVGIENGYEHTTVDILLIAFNTVNVIASRNANNDYTYVESDGYIWICNHTNSVVEITIKQIPAF